MQSRLDIMVHDLQREDAVGIDWIEPGMRGGIGLSVAGFWMSSRRYGKISKRADSSARRRFTYWSRRLYL